LVQERTATIATQLAFENRERIPSLPNFDAKSRELFEKALPRGVLLPRLEWDRDRENYWMSPQQLLRHVFVPGQLIVGKLAGTFLGHLDDRPVVTIAGARAGKTSTATRPAIAACEATAIKLNTGCLTGSLVSSCCDMLYSGDIRITLPTVRNRRWRCCMAI